jgi:16S rRNA (guanine(1405)-N(7))-methyltransferase
MTGEDELDALVNAVLKSAKYRHVCRDLVRHIGVRELAVRRSLKEAVKATKNKLHRVGGVYFKANIDYTRALDELRAAAESRDEERFRRVCLNLMGLHASTKERLCILETFYRTALGGIEPIRTIIDVACGLNPLATPWMGLDEDVAYYAYDVYTDLVDFVGAFMALTGVRGHAEARDVIQDPPAQRADVAFVLKTLPCIEQVDKSAGLRLLEALNARYLLVSFPAHSLGGRRKGMVQNYGARFIELVQDKPWSVRRFEFVTELAFLVDKGARGE